MTRQTDIHGVTVRASTLTAFVATKPSPVDIRDPRDAVAGYVIAARARRFGKTVVTARLVHWDDDGNGVYSYTLGIHSDLVGGYTDISQNTLTVAAADTALADQWLTDASITL